MKVLFVAPANSMHTYKWVDYFKKRGCQIELISLYRAEKRFLDEFSDLKPKVIGGTGSKILDFIVAWFYLAYVISTRKPDIVHGQSAGSHGLLAALSPTRKLVTTVWGSDILIAAQKLYIRPFVKFILARSRVVTCDAHHMITALGMLGVDEGKIELINFGVDTTRLVRLTDGTKRFDHEYRDDAHRKVIISLRNHWPVYDIETLIRAACTVIAKRSDVNFVIAGKGPETQNYIELSNMLGISGHVKFTGGYNGNDIPEMLASCDVYVSCSLSDAGIAASTAEAMSCTVPVVVSDTGENHLWIQDLDNGMLFPAGKVDVLAEKLLLLLNDEKLARRIGERGRQTIVERNDYRNEMEKVYQMYVQLGGA